jgi:hypothetical protein
MSMFLLDIKSFLVLQASFQIWSESRSSVGVGPMQASPLEIKKHRNVHGGRQKV